ncbi:MAG: acetylornithine deacetylase [Gammaproteobacteria bacterium]|nr:acetylornithine deacetylase [Gammaproteobacteria bacterium]
MSLPTFREMLGTLIAEPSVSCTHADVDQSNLRVVEHLAGWLEGLGAAVELMPLPGVAGKANLVATLGAGEGGLVLAGHTDTVPFDEAAWGQDPLAMTERDGRFYGLGACDMKGFFPVALSAAAAFAGRKLRAPLILAATCDEESSMAGGRFLLESGKPRAEAAIIGEPTGLQPIHAHKGFMLISIQLEGAAGHSSNPALGHNALDAMHSVMTELIRFREELSRRHRSPLFEIEVPTLNLGCLRAGDNPNRICGHAELQIDLRLLPGMDSDAVLESLRTRVAAVAAAAGTPATITSLHPPVPAFETAEDGRLVRLLGGLSGTAPGSVSFGTEAHFYQCLGLETVVFGPGSIDQAHQPDEFLAQKQIAPAQDALEQAIAHYCL